MNLLHLDLAEAGHFSCLTICPPSAGPDAVCRIILPSLACKKHLSKLCLGYPAALLLDVRLDCEVPLSSLYMASFPYTRNSLSVS